MKKQTYFNAKTIATVAMFSALAFGVSFIEIPIYEFYNLDFSFAIMLLAAFALGPISGEIVVMISIGLRLPSSSTFFVGEFANFIMAQIFVILPSIAYRCRRKFSTVIVSLSIASVFACGLSLVINRYWLFPLFEKAGLLPVNSATFFSGIWWVILLFNLLKCITNTAITLLLYKRLSVLLHKFVFEEYNRRMEYITNSAKETVKLAKKYGRTLKSGDVVLLDGEMGAGKTVFAKGVALSLGVKDEITSPTYAYMNDYGGKLYHYDCYRLSSGEDAEALGLTDYFYGKGVCLIEWSQNIADVLPENCKRVKIEKIGDEQRRITFS